MIQVLGLIVHTSSLYSVIPWPEVALYLPIDKLL